MPVMAVFLCHNIKHSLLDTGIKIMFSRNRFTNVKVIGIRYLRDLYKGSFIVKQRPVPRLPYPQSRVDGHTQPTPFQLDGEVRQVRAAGRHLGKDGTRGKT